MTLAERPLRRSSATIWRMKSRAGLVGSVLIAVSAEPESYRPGAQAATDAGEDRLAAQERERLEDRRARCAARDRDPERLRDAAELSAGVLLRVAGDDRFQPLDCPVAHA